MREIFSIRGLDIFQKNFQQVVVRCKGEDKLSETIRKETSLLPPSSNLAITNNAPVLPAETIISESFFFTLSIASHILESFDFAAESALSLPSIFFSV